MSTNIKNFQNVTTILHVRLFDRWQWREVFVNETGQSQLVHAFLGGSWLIQLSDGILSTYTQTAKLDREVLYIVYNTCMLAYVPDDQTFEPKSVELMWKQAHGPPASAFIHLAISTHHETINNCTDLFLSISTWTYLDSLNYWLLLLAKLIKNILIRYQN